MAAIRNTRLGNGLRVIHYPIAQTRFVDVVLAVGVGSRFDPPRLQGLSHFMEHMLFRGSRSLPSGQQLNVEFERIGDGLNALTHKEFTTFTTRVPVEALGRALKLLASVVFEPLFEGIETEKEIVLEEILEELDEKGRDADIDNISRTFILGQHPLAAPVLGRRATVRAIKKADLQEFHSRFYVPANMVLAISGGCAAAEAFSAATAAFGGWMPGHDQLAVPVYPVGAEPFDTRHGFRFVEEKASQAQAVLTFLMPGELAPGEMARLFLSRVLDDGIASRLQRAVSMRRGLLYDISCTIESLSEISFFDVQFLVSPAKLPQVLEVVLGELSQLKRELVADDEFKLVRDRFTRDIWATAESSRAMAPLLAEAFLLHLPFPVEPEEYVGRLAEITPECVRAEAEAAFQPDKCALAVRGRLRPEVRRQLRAIIGKTLTT